MYFRRDAEAVPARAAAICAATPELPRPGVLIAREPDAGGVPRWLVGVGGYADDHPAP